MQKRKTHCVALHVIDSVNCIQILIRFHFHPTGLWPIFVVFSPSYHFRKEKNNFERLKCVIPVLFRMSNDKKQLSTAIGHFSMHFFSLWFFERKNQTNEIAFSNSAEILSAERNINVNRIFSTNVLRRKCEKKE